MSDTAPIIALMRAGRWPDAEAQLKALLKRDPDDMTALRLLGTVFHLTGRSKEAIPLLETATHHNPNDVAAILNLGSANLAEGNLNQARSAFEQASKLEPKGSDGPFNLGITELRAGHPDLAAGHFRWAIKCGANRIEALSNLAVAELRAGDFEAGAAVASEVLGSNPNLDAVRFVLVTALTELGRVSEAEAALATANPKSSEAWRYLPLEADLRFRTGGLAEAAITYRRAIEAGDSRPTTQLQLVRCLKESGLAEEAIEVLTQVLARESKNLEAWTLLAQAHRELKDYPQAIDAYERARALAPEATGLDAAQAAVVYMMGEAERGDDLIDAAIGRAPQGVAPWVTRMERQVEQGEVLSALATCDDFLTMRPQDFNMLAAKPFLLSALNRDAEAKSLMDTERLIFASKLPVPDGYESLEAFNAVLAEECQNHPSLSHYGAASKATQNGRQSGNLFFGNSQAFKTFERLLWSAAEQYLERLPNDAYHPYLSVRPQLGGVHAWAVVLERSGHQSAHIHPTGWLSGVYYPKLPDVMHAGTSEDGWIEFGAPPPELTVGNTGLSKRIKPEEGLLILFPSYFYHRTLPYESDDARISMAFDFTPR